ncbi:MAG: restriction endonuclease subunit S [Paludibacter sp.]|nr:restriction endonuclease subunit S [Paludibacter sp.]
MSEWKKYKLGEVAEITSSKRIFLADYVSNGIPFYRSKEVIERFKKSTISTELFIEKSKFEEIKNKFGAPKENDILLTSVGTIGIPFKVRKDDEFYFKDGNLTWFRNYSGQLNPDYLFYWIQSSIGKEAIGKTKIGSTQQALTIASLKQIEITVPDLTTQTQIAQILTSLDDKIELNLQMNQTLEAMAQALFKEWFVKFNFPKCLNLDSLDLPDEQDFDKEKEKNQGNQENPKNHGSDNGLPKGWKVGKLGEIVDVKGGTTPSTTIEEYWNGEFYWTTPKDLSNIQAPVLIDTERKITALGVKQISSGVMPKGTLLLSSRAPIGYIAISQVPISINQGYIAIQGKLVSNLFMLFWLKQNMDAVKSKANGSTFQEISKSNFREIETTIPSKEVLEQFDEMANPIFEKIVENVFQIQTLTQTRDTLLPKLISGKISLNYDFCD